jgi:putative tributyrin esterase
MALLQVNTFSQALSRIITFHIILPNDAPPEMLAGNAYYDRPMKTLYLLHGFSGSTQDWLTGSLIFLV